MADQFVSQSIYLTLKVDDFFAIDNTYNKKMFKIFDPQRNDSYFVPRGLFKIRAVRNQVV